MNGIAQINFRLGPFHLSEGLSARQFLAVPRGATAVHVTFSFGGQGGIKTYFFELQQVVPKARNRNFLGEFGLEKVRSGETFSADANVVPGFPLEIVAAQEWTSLGPISVTMDIRFHGEMSA